MDNNLKKNVELYHEILSNTRKYREYWKDTLKDEVISTLQALSDTHGLSVNITVKSELENLDAVVISLGDIKSGIYHDVNNNIKRHLIKHNGSLVYQQLFNGKIIVMVNYPFIENYGQPHPPKTIAIYRPEELKDPYFVRHLDTLVTEITHWEDYDDDEPNKKIGFKFNFENPVLDPE